MSNYATVRYSDKLTIFTALAHLYSHSYTMQPIHDPISLIIADVNMFALHLFTADYFSIQKQRLELEKEFEGLMKCCLAHDSCYLDCKSEQKYCDTMMKKCLRAYCEGLVGGPKHRKCEGAVDHMLETTEAEGSELYQKFQMLNCQCVSLGREEL